LPICQLTAGYRVFIKSESKAKSHSKKRETVTPYHVSRLTFYDLKCSGKQIHFLLCQKLKTFTRG